MNKFAIVLCGCGVFDGSEIQEAVLTLNAVQKAGHEYQAFAPDIPHAHVLDHLSGKELPNQRSVLSESARIVRGNILPLSQFDAFLYDAIIFPGGFGVAKNLCDYAWKGLDCVVQTDVRKSIESMHALGKPIGALCMGPILLAKVLSTVHITLGSDSADSKAAEAMGATHHVTSPGMIVTDVENKVVTAPCYMLPTHIGHIADEAEQVVRTLLTFME